MIRLLPIVAFLLGFIACGGGENVEMVPVSGTSEGSERPAPFVGGEPRLLTPGIGALIPLRYQIPEGDEERFALQLILGVTAGTGVVTTFVESPPIVLEVEIGPITHRPGGRYRYDLKIRDVDLALPEGTPDEMAEALGREIALMGRIEGWVEVDDRGITREVHGATPAALPPRTETMLGNIRSALQSIPLPEEPVGVGARWEVRRVVDHQSYDVDQVVTYELVDLVGTRGEMRITVVQSADPQPLHLPDGTSAQLDAYTGRGSGGAIFDLTNATPVATMSFQSAMHASATGGGSELVMETLTNVIVQPR